MSLSSALPSYASYAEQTDANLRCARCHTIYCSRPCQAVHWTSGGHNKVCKGLARARREHESSRYSRVRSLASRT